MAYQCEICNKKPRSGNIVSHAHNKTRTRAYPNLKRVRAIMAGTVRRIRVCTRCLRSGLITKAA